MNSTDKVLNDCRGAPLSHCRKLVFAFLSLAIILLAVYGNSFDCSWQFDDEPNITDNPSIHLQEITWQGIKRSLFSDPSKPGFPYRPVACFTFALNYYFGGLDVFGYHLVNLVIHWFSALFLFLFIYHTLNLPKLKPKYGEHAYSLALLAIFLWAINPVQVQAVTYIVQRMASMAGMFFILTMYLYVKARTIACRRRASLFYGMCFATFLLAMGSKENAAMLPLVILAYEALLVQDDPISFLRKNLALMLIVLGCTFLLGVVYFHLKGGSLFSLLKGYEARPFTLEQRLLTEPRVVIFYISLLLYPLTSRLNISHSFELSKSLFDPISTFFAILAIFLLVAFAFCLARKRPLLSFCVLFFFLNHVIESSFLPLEITYEHRNYIPSMLFFLPFATGLLALLERYETKRLMKYTIAAFIPFLLMGFGHAAYLRNFDWKTPGTLWSDSVRKSPDISRPYHNLGSFYHDHGQLKPALPLYEEALRKPPTNTKNEFFITHYNLGKVWAELNDLDRAEFFFRQAVELNPSYRPVYNDLAALYNRQGKKDLAHENLLKVLRLDPYDTFANHNLGLHYLLEGRPLEAIHHLSKALGSDEYKSITLLYLAIAYKQESRLGKAAVLFREALEENPRDIRGYLHLAEVYYKAGHHNRAEKEAEKALNLITSKEVFHKTLEYLRPTDDRTGNLKADGKIVIPLLEQAIQRKTEDLYEWKEWIKGAGRLP